MQSFKTHQSVWSQIIEAENVSVQYAVRPRREFAANLRFVSGTVDKELRDAEKSDRLIKKDRDDFFNWTERRRGVNVDV